MLVLECLAAPGMLAIPLCWSGLSWKLGKHMDTDLFLRRFREGISFPNFVERSILKLPLSKLCAVPFALQNRALFEAEKRAKRCREKGRKRGGQQRGQKGKKDAWKTDQDMILLLVNMNNDESIIEGEIFA